ncbi:putative transposase OrfB (plasmid) [Hartmannibacter diazotrophicus]|uniref:Putative transposase OrfB n=1 Tax=Hartmannibacter diazotrophicus TaxID=1482074 RepID=A0A2C9DE37_9HYPH|nr:putative transposase OrfB [Hartmannibacter diazotrophicus]
MEGFAYLAVVIDLFSRRVIGWSLQSQQTSEVVLQAHHMAVWRRKPQNTVLVHSDQGSQFTSMDWASFLRHHNLAHPMSRPGSCHDNAVAESFFNLLKRERIRRRTYRTRDEARQDVLDYIEMFYRRPPPKTRPQRHALTRRVRTAAPNLNSKGSTERGAIQNADDPFAVTVLRARSPVLLPRPTSGRQAFGKDQL